MAPTRGSASNSKRNSQSTAQTSNANIQGEREHAYCVSRLLTHGEAKACTSHSAGTRSNVKARLPSICWVCASGAATKRTGDSCRFLGQFPTYRKLELKRPICPPVGFRILDSPNPEMCTFHPGVEVSDPVYPTDFVNDRNRPDELKTVLRMKVSHILRNGLENFHLIHFLGTAGALCQRTN